MRIVIKDGGQRFKDTWNATFDKLKSLSTMQTLAEYARHFLLDEVEADIRANLGPSWTETLRSDVDEVSLNNMRVSVSSDKAAMLRAFDDGRTIHSHAGLLWIPLSWWSGAGIRARDFPGGVVGAKYPRTDGGRPLLFSKIDRTPRYFGIDSVTLPKKLHLDQDREAAAYSTLEAMKSSFSS